MPVSRQVYTASPTWTAVQLASTFRSAFIDAGLMTEWHDSFSSSGVENRILRIVYDGTKTYGTTFYWFMFTTSGAFVSLATGWNTTTKQPTGTQYLDFYSTTTNATTNHYQIFTGTSTLTLELYRYTSAVNTDFSWFYLRNGSLSANFSVFGPSSQVATWVDLDKTMFHHYLRSSASVTNAAAGISFQSFGMLRRSYLFGCVLNTYTTTLGSPAPWSVVVSAYSVMGRLAVGASNPSSNMGNSFGITTSTTSPQSTTIILPIGSNSANPAYTADSNPVYTGLPVSYYVSNSSLPSDFGIVPHYVTNTMNPLDKFIVTAGVEEWEIINVANSGTLGSGYANIAFAARVV